MMKNWICLLLAAFLTVSCLSKPEEIQPLAWAYADLRALDPPGDADPALDVIAIYTRFLGSEFQVRLDLLDLSFQVESDLFLALDYQPGGGTRLPGGAQTDLVWDALVILPASGPANIRTFRGDSITSARLRILRDPVQDTIHVLIENKALASHSPFSNKSTIGVQVITALPNTGVIADRTSPIQSNGMPPGRLPVLVALWNTLPATTPAQALRRWNGAHTGPFNERHGLQSLFEAVEHSRFPVALLDLKSPETLSYLDYLGTLPRVRKLSEAGLLILPEVVPLITGVPGQAFSPPAWVFEEVVEQSRQYSKAFGLSASSFLYFSSLFHLAHNGYAQSSSIELLSHVSRQFRFLFTHPLAASQTATLPLRLAPLRWHNLQVLSLPESSTASQQVANDGPSLELRRALAAAASASGPAERLVFLLGGDLSRSAWGQPEAARNSLHYLAAHPWIQAVSAYDLLSAGSPGGAFQENSSSGMQAQQQPFPLHDAQGIPIPSGLTASQIQELLLAALQASPPGAVTNAAWRAYLALLSPAVPEIAELHALRANYLGQIGHLLAAARWDAYGLESVCRPPAGSPCLADLDWDGQDEIILANQSLFSILETEGGILTFGLARTTSGIHQVIGPTYQFTTGMSDPTLWQIGMGIAGDPGQVPGALADTYVGFAAPNWEIFESQLSENVVTLSTQDGKLKKTVQLDSQGWQIIYESAQPVRVQIPLVIDPWSRFEPGWGNLYIGNADPRGWSWGLRAGPQVRVETSGELLTQTFNSTHLAVQSPEDPNFAYSAGHYLPFPMALAEVSGEGKFRIMILWTP